MFDSEGLQLTCMLSLAFVITRYNILTIVWCPLAYVAWRYFLASKSFGGNVGNLTTNSLTDFFELSKKIFV